jgi:hypothetical protein
MEEIFYSWTDLQEYLYSEILLKHVLKIQVWLKSEKITSTLDQDLSAFVTISGTNICMISSIDRGNSNR